MLDIVTTFQRARRDPDVVLLEGFHALKHALRFRAEIYQVITTDQNALIELADQLAPDVRDEMLQLMKTVEHEIFRRMGNNLPRVEVLAIAKRPQVDGIKLLASTSKHPIVLLEDPQNFGNLGAIVRTAAAAEAAGVITTGRNDPWNPMAVRGAAGLHFALPVARVGKIPDTARPIVALDPDGEPLAKTVIPENAILAFGTERYGLSPQLLERADLRVRIPMQTGVSSLNLAASVAIMLYRS